MHHRPIQGYPLHLAPAEMRRMEKNQSLRYQSEGTRDTRVVLSSCRHSGEGPNDAAWHMAENLGGFEGRLASRSSVLLASWDHLLYRIKVSPGWCVAVGENAELYPELYENSRWVARQYVVTLEQGSVLKEKECALPQHLLLP